MYKKWREYSLTTKVMVGMILGLLVGVLSRTLFPENVIITSYITNGFFNVVGQIFITSLKMLVVPLIFTSIICGTCSLSDASTLGRLGGKTLLLYLLTTAIAISLAIVAALVFAPGEGANLEATSSFTPGEAPSLAEVLIRLFPSNPIEALASGNTLQIIVFFCTVWYFHCGGR